MRHDRRIALADARGLDDDDVEARDLAGRDRVRQRLADLAASLARRERAHVDPGARTPRIDRVHTNAVAEQCAAALAPRRVDRDHGDCELVALVQPKPADDFIGQRTLAGAACAGDAQHRHLGGVGRLVQRLDQLRIDRIQFERADHAGQRTPALRQVLVREGGDRCRRLATQIVVAFGDHEPDHSLQAHLLAVFGREDARHTVVVQLLDFGRDDNAAATAENANAFAAPLPQQVEHVLEELDVPALVARHRDALHVFLQGSRHDFFHRTVVPEMYHFGAHALQDATHDVDAGVVAVEERRRGDEAHLVLRSVAGELLDFGQVGHRALLHRRPPAGSRIIVARRGRSGNRADRGSRGGATLAAVDVNVNLASAECRHFGPGSWWAEPRAVPPGTGRPAGAPPS